jgi:hypothetical protein
MAFEPKIPKNLNPEQQEALYQYQWILYKIGYIIGYHRALKRHMNAHLEKYKQKMHREEKARKCRQKIERLH